MSHTIYKDNTPALYRRWDFAEIRRQTDDCVWFGIALIPLALGVVMFLLLSLADFLIPTELIPFTSSAGAPDYWVWATALGSLIPQYGLEGYWLYKHHHYTRMRVGGGEPIWEMELEFRQLPSELRAEVSQVRELAMEFHVKGNNEGLRRCKRIVHEIYNLWHQRDEAQMTRAANNPEIERVLKYSLDYASETEQLYKAELTTGPAKHDNVPRSEKVHQTRYLSEDDLLNNDRVVRGY